MEGLTLSSTVCLSTGFDMPRLGFGVYRNYTTHESVLEAFRAGYRHVDSAQAYRNEAHVGTAFRESGLTREDVFITTKCISKTHGYDSTLRAVDMSLQRLEMDYIDLYLIHDPFKGAELRLQTYRALLDAQNAGKICTVGVSNFGVRHLEEIRIAGLQTPAVNQIEVRTSTLGDNLTSKYIDFCIFQLHPFCQQREIVKYCHDHDIVVQAYSPLICGNMDNPVFTALAKKHKRQAAQILLRWSLQHGFIPLPKSATPARIHSNTTLYDFVLDAEDMALLDGLDRDKEGAVTWNPVDAK